MSNGTRYFVLVRDDPGHEGEALSVSRWVQGPEVKTERFDGRKWVHNANLLAATGIGGSESYERVDEAVARQAVGALFGQKAVSAAFGK